MSDQLRKILSLMMVLAMVFLPVQNSFSGVATNLGSPFEQSLSIDTMTTSSSSTMDDCCDQDGCKVSYCASCAFVASPMPSLISAQSVIHHDFLVFKVSPHKSQLRTLYRPPII